ncbi:unnamed protein product [Amoebophrya sp. A120]|nr:unnamed protein product [Amoebophrya sp. A120]|eukprot:GSA120T00013451001.1
MPFSSSSSAAVRLVAALLSASSSALITGTSGKLLATTSGGGRIPERTDRDRRRPTEAGHAAAKKAAAETLNNMLRDDPHGGANTWVWEAYTATSLGLAETNGNMKNGVFIVLAPSEAYRPPPAPADTTRGFRLYVTADTTRRSGGPFEIELHYKGLDLLPGPFSPGTPLTRRSTGEHLKGKLNSFQKRFLEAVVSNRASGTKAPFSYRSQGTAVYSHRDQYGRLASASQIAMNRPEKPYRTKATLLAFVHDFAKLGALGEERADDRLLLPAVLRLCQKSYAKVPLLDEHRPVPNEQQLQEAVTLLATFSTTVLQLERNADGTAKTESQMVAWLRGKLWLLKDAVKTLHAGLGWIKQSRKSFDVDEILPGGKSNSFQISPENIAGLFTGQEKLDRETQIQILTLGHTGLKFEMINGQERKLPTGLWLTAEMKASIDAVAGKRPAEGTSTGAELVAHRAKQWVAYLRYLEAVLDAHVEEWLGRRCSACIRTSNSKKKKTVTDNFMRGTFFLRPGHETSFFGTPNSVLEVVRLSLRDFVETVNENALRQPALITALHDAAARVENARRFLGRLGCGRRAR